MHALVAEAIKHLEEKYFYGSDSFSARTREVSIRVEAKNSLNNAVVYESFPGAPFMLLVSAEDEITESLHNHAVEYIQATETIGILVYFLRSKNHIEVYRRRFRDDHFEQIQDLEYYYKGSGGSDLRLFEPTPEYETNSLESISKLLPIDNKLENLFFEIHSLMRDIEGLHADDALEELCKLLYLKSFIEEQPKLLPVMPINSSSFGTVEEYAGCLRGIYRQAIDYDLRVFALKIPEYKRSRGVFDLPIYLSSATLVKAFVLIENYSLLKSGADLKGRAFQKVLDKSVRSGMGQYFTPVQVCNMMVQIVSPKSSDLILDPFCGSGHFLSLSLDYIRNRTDEGSKEYHEFAFGKLHGIEKSERMTRIAMTDMRLNGDGHSNIRCTDSLLDFRNYPDLKPDSFDLILTNPPFGSILGEEAFGTLAKFDLCSSRKKVPLEVLGLERSIQFLRPGGRLGIVLPESIFNSEANLHVRTWVKSKIVPRIIIDLPNETFSPFGANVRSGVLFGRKLLPGETVDPTTSVCMIKIDSLGYNASGRAVGVSEADEAIKIARHLIEEEGW